MTDKEQIAIKTVKRYMWWSMGAGLIPFPVVDIAAVTGVQLKMLAAISKIYGVEFSKSRGKAVAGALIGSLVPGAFSYGVGYSVMKEVPVVGFLLGSPLMVLFSGATAWALGKVFIQHFESGGTFLDFNPEEVKEYFKQQFDEGRKVAAMKGTEENVEVPG
jgi:uncharacterized protein (DUF697 family)